MWVLNTSVGKYSAGTWCEPVDTASKGVILVEIIGSKEKIEVPVTAITKRREHTR